MHIFKKEQQDTHFQEVLLTSRICRSPTSPFFPPGPVPIPPPKHHRWDWNYEGRVTPKGSVEAPPQDCGAGKAFPSNNGNKDKVNELLEVNGKHYGNTYIYKMDSLYLTFHPQFPGFRFEKPVFYEGVSPYHGLFWDVGRSLSWIGRPHCLAVSIGQLANGCTQFFFQRSNFQWKFNRLKTLTAWYNLLLHILTCFRTSCSRFCVHDHVQTIKGILVTQP